MLIKTIFSGFGGQGVLSMGQILANAVMIEGKQVTYMPSYGAEVRGGTANCTVTVSDEEIASPIASEPDFVIAFNQPSFQRFQNILHSGGSLLFNSSLVKPFCERGDIELFGIPTTELATKLGSVKATNMVMLGAFVSISRLVQLDTIIDNLTKILGASKSGLLKINREALQTGFNFIKE